MVHIQYKQANVYTYKKYINLKKKIKWISPEKPHLELTFGFHTYVHTSTSTHACTYTHTHKERKRNVLGFRKKYTELIERKVWK